MTNDSMTSLRVRSAGVDQRAGCCGLRLRAATADPSTAGPVYDDEGYEMDAGGGGLPRRGRLLLAAAAFRCVSPFQEQALAPVTSDK